MSEKKIVAVIGSYRREGIINEAVTEILSGAVENGVVTEKLFLLNYNIEFCRNCRSCMQQPGPERGKCVIDDDLELLLGKMEAADGLVLAAPVNVGNLNALTRRFMERCVGYGYWPWNSPAPKMREGTRKRPSLLVSSSAAPAWMGRLFSGAHGALKQWAKLLGAKPVGVLWVGLVNKEKIAVSEGKRKKARKLGKKLARACFADK